MGFSGSSLRKAVSLTVTYPSKLTQAFETWWGLDSWVSVLLKTENWKRCVWRYRRVCAVRCVLWLGDPSTAPHSSPVPRPSHSQNLIQLASPRRPRLGLIQRFLALGRVEESALGPGALSRCLAQPHSTGDHSGCPSGYQLAEQQVTGEWEPSVGRANTGLQSYVAKPGVLPGTGIQSRFGFSKWGL